MTTTTTDAYERGRLEGMREAQYRNAVSGAGVDERAAWFRRPPSKPEMWQFEKGYRDGWYAAMREADDDEFIYQYRDARGEATEPEHVTAEPASIGTVYATADDVAAAHLPPGAILVDGFGTAWQHARDHDYWYCAAPCQPRGGLPGDLWGKPYTLVWTG